MPGSFSLNCEVIARVERDPNAEGKPRLERTVQITVSSGGGWSGDVNLAYTTAPESPDVQLSKGGAQVYVPKNGSTSDAVLVVLVNVNVCTFTAVGTDIAGTLSASDDVTVY